MGERVLMQGNEAIGWGAIYAGCRHFFGYPITPQNEITEFFARELPKRGGVFIQTESETSSMNMVFGAAAAGVRAMTSTSSVGFSLMQETFSHAVMHEYPCVVVDVQRGGPGAGSSQHSQMDYLQTTWGGGHGGYRNIVLAPASVQECFELIQLAFYLADKYWNPVIVLSDALLGQMTEPLELQTTEFGPLPEKVWALRGKGGKEGRHDFHPLVAERMARFAKGWVFTIENIWEKFKEMAANEVRYETYMADDADLLLVAFGYVARVARQAANLARAEGLKVGLIRPITLWPFPYGLIEEKASKGAEFLVVEDNMGQMVEDVRIGAKGRTEIGFLGMSARNTPSMGGMIFPDRVFEETKRLVERRG
jgi:2-oxoglutarate ferredoxin oxidoreductase subunit alpha